MPQLDLTYPTVLGLLQGYLPNGRTETRAFLAWFLTNYYRLDEIEANDCVCDGPDDKGIDGIYVDETNSTIDVFQSRLFQNNARTVGDTSLKELLGTLSQLETTERVEHIVNTTANTELAGLLKDTEIAKKVGSGFAVRGIFVTNAARDRNAINYLEREPRISLYDEGELQSRFVSSEPTAPLQQTMEFDIQGFDSAEYAIGSQAKLIVAPLLASDLVNMGGIASGELFTWNVRQSLGRTNVNKDIATSVKDVSDHKNFLLFHNGITVLCSSAGRTNEKVTISDYTVVNGCQSLTTLYENRQHISPDLRVITRLIELPPEGELARKITDHSNNQNGILPRDLRANSALQRRLQNEFQTKYGGRIFLRIKRGEQSPAQEVIDNDTVARVLLSFDSKEPWTSHQTYRLFEELHSQIFGRPEVTAERIVAINDVSEAIQQKLGEVNNQLLARYTLTRYFLIYLVREALETTQIGKRFCQMPGEFISEDRGRDRLKWCVRRLVHDLIIDLNAEVKEREENNTPFDFKRDLKSVTAVRGLRTKVIPAYESLVSRARVPSFGEDWEASRGLTQNELSS